MYAVSNSKAALDTYTTHSGLQAWSHPSDFLWPLFVRSHTIWASRGHRAAGVVASTPSMTSACGMLRAHPAPWSSPVWGEKLCIKSSDVALWDFYMDLSDNGRKQLYRCSCWAAGLNSSTCYNCGHVTKIVRNARQMNLVNVIIVIEAKLRWVPIAAILSLRGIPGGPQIDLMLSGVSANYTSLSWVDLQWILWLGLPFLIAHGKT